MEWCDHSLKRFMLSIDSILQSVEKGHLSLWLSMSLAPRIYRVQTSRGTFRKIFLIISTK